jgi:hypothetical protein
VNPGNHDKQIGTLVREIDDAGEVPIRIGTANSAQDFELLARHL